MTGDRPVRLTSAMVVSLLCRQVQAAGGFAAVLHRGDDGAGAVMVECVDRGRRQLLLERATDLNGRDLWRGIAPTEDEDSHRQMMERRIRNDPDMWVIELDIADPERFIAQLFD